VRRPPISPRELLLAALTGRRDGRRRGPSEYPALLFGGYPGHVQCTYRDRQTARLLERNGLLDPTGDKRWRLPEDMAEEMGSEFFVALHSWRLTAFGRVIARACRAGRI